MLEPADSQEAYDFVAEAFALSEEFDTPVMLRSTTRRSHGRGRVLPRVPVAAAGASLRARHRQVRHGPAERAPPEPPRARAPAEAAPPRRGVAAQRPRSRHGRLRHHRVGRRLPVRPRGVPQGVGPQARPVAPAAVSRRWRGCTSRCRASPSSRSSIPFLEEQVRALGCPSSARRSSRPTASSTPRRSFAPSSPSSRTSRRAAAGPVIAAGAAPGDAAGGRARPPGAPARALPGLLAPVGLRGPAAAQAGAARRHRLLHARRAAAAHGSRQLPVHGGERRDDVGLQQGAGPQGSPPP